MVPFLHLLSVCLETFHFTHVPGTIVRRTSLFSQRPEFIGGASLGRTRDLAARAMWRIALALALATGVECFQAPGAALPRRIGAVQASTERFATSVRMEEEIPADEERYGGATPCAQLRAACRPLACCCCAQLRPVRLSQNRRLPSPRRAARLRSSRIRGRARLLPAWRCLSSPASSLRPDSMAGLYNMWCAASVRVRVASASGSARTPAPTTRLCVAPPGPRRRARAGPMGRAGGW